MATKKLAPDDPEMFERFRQWLRSMSQEEFIAWLSRAPGWDPAWANGAATAEGGAVSDNGQQSGAGEAETWVASRASADEGSPG
jgi:hypothetical protein